MVHEVSEGFVRQIGRNYFMILTVNGQRQQRKTGTNDYDKAIEMLDQWKAEEKAGVATTGSKTRYESMRDDYVALGSKTLQTGVQRDLDEFFQGLYIHAINVRKLDQFRTWRENKAEVLETKAETIAKEVELRKMQMLRGRKKLSADQVEKITADATLWVENGVKATTNKRLTILRAMMNFMAKRGVISRSDVPVFPIASGVDNKRRGFVAESDFTKVLGVLPKHLHPFVKFLNATGMRSGQAKKLTWDMVDKDITELHVPGELTKNGEDFTLPLVHKDGKPIFDFVSDMKHLARLQGQPIFDTRDFLKQWRIACDKLGYGIFNRETRAYRGLRPHDFRRTAARNMTKNGIAQPVAMAVSGHKTDSIFRRYAITDKGAVQDAFGVLARK
jgi:integrase